MAAEQSNLIPTTGYASIASRAYGQGDFFNLVVSFINLKICINFISFKRNTGLGDKICRNL
jgi:hypothetical protein